MRELLVEIASQPIQLLGLAQVLGRNRLVALPDVGVLLGSARLVLTLGARAPRLIGGLRVAHVGVLGHVGGGRVGRLARAVRQFVGRDFHFLHAHAVGVLGLLGLALLALAFLVVAFALIVALVVGVARALIAHFKRVEQVVHDVAETTLLLDEFFQPIELAPRAVLDEGTPQVDQLAC